MAYFAMFCLFSLPPNPPKKHFDFFFQKTLIMLIKDLTSLMKFRSLFRSQQHFKGSISHVLRKSYIFGLSHFTCPTMECYFKPALLSQAIYQNFSETSILRLDFSAIKQNLGSRWYFASLRSQTTKVQLLNHLKMSENQTFRFPDVFKGFRKNDWLEMSFFF